MRDRSSFKLCSSDGAGPVSAVAAEARSMVRRAAEPVRPGETVKAQMRRAERALNYGGNDRWRIRAAWYGEAGCWGAGAFRDLQERFRRWRDRVERQHRADIELERSRLHSLRHALAATDPEFHRETLRAIDDALRLSGGGD